MQDDLTKLTPNSVLIMGVVWTLREVFGFLHKLYIAQRGDAEKKEMVTALSKVSHHIEGQTELIKEYTFQIKLLQNKMELFESRLAAYDKRG